MRKWQMLNRGILKAAIPIIIAATGAVVGTALPASATASGQTFRLIQRVNGFNMCLDAGFEFSRCQYGPSPDDPPALEKWLVTALPNGTEQIQNGSQCLDVTGFTAPCTSGDASQQWVRVSAGNDIVKVVNRSSGQRQCLDSFWTFHPCTRGDKQQIWRFKLVS